MKAISLAQFMAQDMVPIRYLIYKWIPKPGRVLLVGPPKVGKSFLALQMALAMAQGTPFMGRPAIKSRVLYLQFDTPHEMWYDRLHDLRNVGVDLSGDIIFNNDGYAKGWDVRQDADRKEMRGIIDTVDPDCVIFDTLRKIHKGKESDSGDMSRVFDLLSSLTQHRASLIVHHTHKINERRDGRPAPSDAARGSTSQAADADMTILMLNKILTTESRFDEEVALRYERDDATNFIIFPEVKDEDTRVNQVEALCKEFPNQTHYQLITLAHKRLGMSKATFYRIAERANCIHKETP